MPDNTSRSILLALWLKAWAHTDNEFRVECQNPRDALRLKLSLYAAGKPARDGRVEDQSLIDAVRGVTIIQEGATLKMVKRSELSFMKAAIVALGGAMPSTDGGQEELVFDTPEEADAWRGVQQKLHETSEQPDPEPAKPRSTPYYTREG